MLNRYLFNAIFTIWTCFSFSAFASPKVIPFRLIQHQIVVEGAINGIKSTFILDTGAGMNIISPSFCARIQCQKYGTYTNERSPGETVTLDLSKVAQLSFGHQVGTDISVGIYPLLDNLPAEFGRIDGMISLEFLKDRPFSIDYKNQKIIFEDDASLAKKASSGIEVPVQVEQDKHTLTVSVRVLVNGNLIGHFLVDAGSQHTIVDPNFAPQVNALALADAPQIHETDLTVLHQKAFGGGILGSIFLGNHLTTFDIKNWRLIFNRIDAH